MAMRNPRDEDQAAVKIKRTCQNLAFAEKARYRKPVGKEKNNAGEWVQKYVEGPSIRFAEEMLRCWGNALIQMQVVYDDANLRKVKVSCRDVQSNLTYSTEFTIEKTVERKKSDGREVVSERLNSYNERVFIVVATEDEILQKVGILTSKWIRNNGLRLVPDHIVSEAMDKCRETVKEGIDKDPEKYKRKMLDAFSELNILPADIERYVGCKVSQLTPAQIEQLRVDYTSLKEGTTTWAELLEEKKTSAGKEKPAKKTGTMEMRAGNPATHTKPGESHGKAETTPVAKTETKTTPAEKEKPRDFSKYGPQGSNPNESKL